MKKLYYTYKQLKKDLPNLNNVEIKVVYDFEQTIDVNTFEYKSFLKQLQRQNITIKFQDKIEGIMIKRYRNKKDPKK